MEDALYMLLLKRLFAHEFRQIPQSLDCGQAVEQVVLLSRVCFHHLQEVVPKI